MAEEKTSGRKNKKKNCWSIQGLEKRCQDMIQEGILVKEGSPEIKEGALEKICEVINSEFADKLDAIGKKVTPYLLNIRLDKLIWMPKVIGDLWTAYSHKMLSQFTEAYGYIPDELVQKKSKTLKGLTHASAVSEFKAGMGRLSTDSMPADAGNFQFPRISYKEPFVITDKKDWRVLVINATHIGIRFTDIVRSTSRRALAEARKRRVDAVTLTNIIDIDTKKTAGPLKVYRAMVSGIQINPDRLPVEYRQEVKDILSGKITDELIYLTLAEKFNEILDGLHKITHRPRGKGPEFPGPVYVALGVLEEELINAAAYYECRYRTIIKQNKIEAQLNIASHRLEVAKQRNNAAGIRYWNTRVTVLGQMKVRVIITGTADPMYEFYRRRMRAYVVKRLDDTIPNCKVISQGSTYLRAGDKIAKIHIPGHDSITDGLLADYCDHYGAEVFRDILADITVICHPHPLNHRFVGREDSKDGQPVTKWVHVAPPCLDGVFLRDEFKDSSKAVHPVHRMVYDWQFKPGVLFISCINGIISADTLPIESLDAMSEPRKSTNFAYPNPKSKNIIILANTDNHFGSNSRREIFDPLKGIHYGVCEAALELMRRYGLLAHSKCPVHMSMEMDDLTNGDMFFKPRYRPHPAEMSIMEIQRWMCQMIKDVQYAAERGDNAGVVKLTEEINRISLYQLLVRGEDFPYHQMKQAFERHLKPNMDFYSASLRKFVDAGLVIRGISDINKTMKDGRDIGVHNWPNGNHRLNTLEGADQEGDYLADGERSQLGQEKFWQDYNMKNPGFLEKVIRAPRFGGETFGAGTIQAPGGYEWGLRILSSPPRLGSWSDILAAMIRNDMARGDDTYGVLKHITLTLLGDKHFFAEGETERITYVMCASATHTDSYGSTGGFPPNNTGMCFICLPADGPEAGPIMVRKMSHDFLRAMFANPGPFDWEAFLPNPV